MDHSINESELCKESMPDHERLMESFESAYDVTYFHDSESSSDDERVELNAELLTKNAKPAPLSLSDLRYLVINPDGTISISKPTLKANETNSQSRNATSSAQPLTEHNRCTVNCDSQLSNQSVNLDILNENENFTEEETFSEGDSVSGNHMTNESSVSSTHLSQNEQSQFNNVSVTSDPVNQTETRRYEPDPFSDDEIEIVTICDKSATNFRFPSQNEQCTTYEPTSESISEV